MITQTTVPALVIAEPKRTQVAVANVPVALSANAAKIANVIQPVIARTVFAKNVIVKK